MQNITIANGSTSAVCGSVSGGGAILVYSGTTTIIGSTFSNNRADGNGGGAILVVTDATSPALNITNSTFSTNQANGAFGEGGAINSTNALTISGSTFSSNQASVNGGAIAHILGVATLTNNTITGNNAGSNGGGIYFRNDGSMSLNNVTIASNQAGTGGAGSGGGLFTFAFQGAPATFSNTIIAGNSAPGGGAPDCGGGALNSVNNNLIQDTTGCTIIGATSNNITGQNPLLGALANNGGPTQTRALLAGSLAIDRGNNATCATTDQRGVGRPRPTGGRCDIGAYEYDPPAPTPTPTPLPRPADVPEADTLLLFGGGISSLGVWLRWQWSKRKREQRTKSD